MTNVEVSSDVQCESNLIGPLAVAGKVGIWMAGRGLTGQTEDKTLVSVIRLRQTPNAL